MKQHRLGQTFSADEVAELCKVFAAGLRGADVSQLVRSENMRRVYARMLRARDRAAIVVTDTPEEAA